MLKIFSKIWIVVAVAIFAVAGIFCWQYFETQKQIEISEEKITELKQHKEEIMENEIAGWKTYRNEEYGFEIKYPQVYDEENYIECRPKIVEEKDEIIIFIGPLILKILNSQGLELFEYVNQYKKDWRQVQDFGPIENISVDAKDAVKIVSEFIGASYSEPQDIFVKSKDKIYHFNYDDYILSNCLYEVDQLPSNIAEKMLSSFRFLPEGTTIEVEIFEEKIAEPKKSAKQIKEQMEKQDIAYNEKRQRDAHRKADIGQIVMALEIFYEEIGEYAQIGGTATMPSSIGVEGFLISESVMADISKDPVSGESYIWIDNTKDGSKFCIYAQLEQGGYLAGSHKGTKTLDFPPKTLSCW